jgi:hypothetical protein
MVIRIIDTQQTYKFLERSKPFWDDVQIITFVTMTRQQLTELREKNFITEEQYQRIYAITSGRIVSVFYELRTLLYLGVLLFSSGMGLLIYDNIGQMGHLLSLGALGIATIACFGYAIWKRVPYTHGQAVAPTPYYDYVVLLGCLLLLSVLGYAQFQFGILNDRLEWITLLTAIFFFTVAYRFDHLGILSMAITAFISFGGIRTSFVQWAQGDFFSRDLYAVAIILGAVFVAVSAALDKKGIKQHFSFTYQNFGLLLFFVGCFAGMWGDDFAYGYFVLLIYAGCAVAWLLARWRKSFLFLLYAFLSAYIATTVWLADLIFDQYEMLWFLYSIFSCGALIFFVIRYRTFFRQ